MNATTTAPHQTDCPCKEHDRAHAFEYGFWKAAVDAGLTKEEYEEMRAVAIKLLQNITNQQQ